MRNKLILLRHGQSVYNLENRFTGWRDVDLSEKGIQEAKAAAEKLKSQKIDQVYTSILIRAKHTYQIIEDIDGLQNVPLKEDKALNERKYGDLEGLNKADIAEKFGEEQVHIWRRSFDIPPPNGESLKDTYYRVIPYFKSDIKKDLDKGLNILVVAHGNSLRALVMYLDNLSKEEIVEKEIATGVPIIYDWPVK
ncbi:2,3-bisphosphoglycerate-dependent phosphoglycerate mutase [Pedobacter sp. SD-b]|uniref:2,3-bisphosphoglycerate-dependent phosphoglycerate mutase n=1 Tax=Pedobacter segetis TaxID=2793069 RepID=A0ABS1BNN7_9SPHI|nr:2,3-bisphosphoglycerate-dependent phosphoglycerate mutase [Pedobacter segetis]MBK0384508.1 2,3-bisphosphoglycerate-dependent phosphoglycerate mutase [Pedobacter segetis]